MSEIAAVLPLANTRMITVPKLSPAARAAELEALAAAPAQRPWTRFQMSVVLQALAGPGLHGDTLWRAWQRVEAAVACRDTTQPGDGDYPAFTAAAQEAICAFVYGPAGQPATAGAS